MAMTIPFTNEVDWYHNDREKEFLRLDQEGADKSDEDDSDDEEAVMDLAVGGDSSSDDDDSEDESGDEEKGNDDNASGSSSEENDELGSSDEDTEEEKEDVRAWGKKKSSYYHGDTADLEIGQDQDDAFLEEAAAKEVQAARYKEMSEDDFVLSDTEDNNQDAPDAETENVSNSRDMSKLSLKDKQKILDKQHPEMLPLLSHFADVVEDLEENSIVATRAIFNGEEGTAETVGATKMGQKFLLTKTMLQSSTALNLAMYLVLKSHQSTEEGTDPSLIQSHPVMLRLQKFNSMMQKLEDGVEEKVGGLRQQLRNLVKAAALMEAGEIAASDQEADDSDKGSEESVTTESKTLDKMDKDVGKEPPSSPDESSESDDSADENAVSRSVLTEARFGLRPNEIVGKSTKARKRRRAILVDTVDDEDEIEETRQKSAMQSLAMTVNSIEQRSATRKRRAAPTPEQLDEHEEEDGELRRGLEMMEAELGKLSNEEEDNAADDGDYAEQDDDDMDGDYYADVTKKSKSKKNAKQERYRVQPKFPRMDPEVEGERPLSKQILKNRGLVAHKAKINRNPRVKKREQYRKAIIRRKGAVREVRKDEAHKYGGEETGIKSNLSRSRKLAVEMQLCLIVLQSGDPRPDTAFVFH
jgi:U3 small nucleolar RNA-associated protein 3